MSFDLNFCRVDGSVHAISELREYFAASALFQITDTEDGGAQFWYQNPATEVYCDFSYSPQDASEFEGCSSSGLTFNLNYARPSFFAYETMPLVEAFCERFNLMVDDPQEETVQPAKTPRLIRSWRAHNARAVAAMVAMAEEERPVLHYLSEERATEWWQFMRGRDKIEANLTEDLFVPSVVAALNPAQQAYTFIVWPNAIPQFFPRCDYVCVSRKMKRLFGTKEEMGLVAYDAVLAALGPLLDDYESDGQSVKYLSIEKAIVAAPLVEKLPLQSVDLSQHSRISADSLHDVDLSAEDPAVTGAV